MTNSSVQIIYLNGPSSSGKTTLAKGLQHAFDQLFLHVGIDKIIGWMPEKVNDWTGGTAPLGYSWKKSTDESGNPIQELQIGPYAKKIADTFQEVVLLLAKMGHHLVIDDVSFGKIQVDEWKALLRDFKVLWVGVNAPLSVLEQREKERGNRIVGSARGQFHRVHADATYDVEIDTHHATLVENVEKIRSLASARENQGENQPLYGVEHGGSMYKVVIDHNPSHSNNEVVKEGLIRSYEAQFGERDKQFSVFLKSDLGEIFGGIQAMFDSEAIYIEALWIEENLRKQGYGKKLLIAAEGAAIKNGCIFSLVDTWDFQAEEFYLKNGYVRIGELKNYWHGYSKIFLRKKLRPSALNIE